MLVIVRLCSIFQAEVFANYSMLSSITDKTVTLKEELTSLVHRRQVLTRKVLNSKIVPKVVLDRKN